MNNISEKRRYPRVKKPYITMFMAKPPEIRSMASEEWDMVTVANLSSGGIFFYSRTSLEVGMVLDLKIEFPLFLTIICTGRVIHAKKHLDTTLGYAIEFTEIEEHMQKLINSTVSDDNTERLT